MIKKNGRRRRPLTLAAKARKTRKAHPERDQQERIFLTFDPVQGFSVDGLLYDSTSDPSSSDDCGYLRIVFKIGDDVILNSEDDATGNTWIGKIMDVRASRDRKEVLAKVRWYYSRKDVADHVKTFKPTWCSPYERLFSDEYDYVSPYAFQAVTYVHDYDETVLDPPDIGPDAFFVRSSLLFHRKQVKPPLGGRTCFCQEPYVLYPAPLSTPSQDTSPITPSPSPVRDVMHFCPSLNCRKWFHSSCLTTMGHIDQSLPAATRGIRLLAVDPDQEVPFASFSWFYEEESQNIVSDDPITIQNALKMFDRPISILSHLPPGLINIAMSPIVRCSGVPDGWAVGNVADVVLARQFVHTAITHGGAPEHHPEYLEILQRERERVEVLNLLLSNESLSSESKDKGKDEGEKDEDEVMQVSVLDELDMMSQLCDDLGEFDGLLAVPYASYWERREREFREAEELLNGPAFVCPHCRGAI